jgi:hypothetical protein
MARISVLSSFTALMLVAAPAFAQEVGGIQLRPEVLNLPDAQQQALNLALSLLQRGQIAQQLLQGRNTASSQGSPVPAPTNPNAVNPSANLPAVNQQTIASMRGDPGYLAGFSFGQPLAPSRARPVVVPSYVDQSSTYVDQSRTFVLKALNSPVSIGNGNIVNQQVANSTAINPGGAAIAGSVVNQGNGGSGGASLAQKAVSSAISHGGVARSTASNNSVVNLGSGRSGRASLAQKAVSSAISQAGVAHSTASNNSNVLQ